MRPSLILRARQPLIKFLGKRSIPKSVDHSPQPHPASPSHQLPDSFADYRSKAQQHGPLGGQNNGGSVPRPPSGMGGPMTYGFVGGRSARELGSIEPKEGEYFDVSELPKRFHRRKYTDEEIDAVSSAGASMW